MRHQTAFDARRGTQQQSEERVGVILHGSSNFLDEPSTSVVMGTQTVRMDSYTTQESTSFSYRQHLRKSPLLGKSNLPQHIENKVVSPRDRSRQKAFKIYGTYKPSRIRAPRLVMRERRDSTLVVDQLNEPSQFVVSPSAELDL